MIYPGRKSLHLLNLQGSSCRRWGQNSPNGSARVTLSRATSTFIPWLLNSSIPFIEDKAPYDDYWFRCMLYPEGWYFKLIGYNLQAWASATPLKSCSSFCFWQEGVKRPYLPSLWNKNYQTKYKKVQLSRHWCQVMKDSDCLRDRKQIWLCLKVKVKLLSRVQLFLTPWTVAYHAPPSTGFSRQKY